MDPLLIVAGLGIGILVGVTGMGGGSLMTPILILLFGTAPATAIGSDVAYSAITKSVGGWRHFKLKNVNLGVAGWLAIGSVPAAVAGVYVIDLLRERFGDSLNDIVMTILAFVLILVGLTVLIRALFIPHMVAGEREHVVLTRREKIVAVAVGVSTGFVIGMTSAGSGTLIAVFLIMYYKLAPRRVVGTDVFHAAVLLFAAGIAHTISGNVNWTLVGTILIGSVPGIWIGSHLTTKLPTGMLRNALGVVMIASAIALFDKAGLALPLIVVIAIPASLIIGLLIQQIVRRRPDSTASETGS